LREKVGCKGKHMVYIKLNVKLFIAFWNIFYINETQ
jgi:hypothetical protein